MRSGQPRPGAADAGYTSNLYLVSAGGPVLIANSSQVGKVVDLENLSSLYNFKHELIFGIFVLNTGNSFLMGPGARNGDGVAHATVDYAEGTTSDFATLGFEDLFGAETATTMTPIFSSRAASGALPGSPSRLP